MPITATSAPASAVIDVASERQRRARRESQMTLELSTTGATGGTGATGATGSLASSGAAGIGGGGSGKTIGACGSAWPIAVRMFSQTIGRGSTEPTIWFSTPSLYSQACTIAVKSPSTDIMVSTCERSSTSRVPSAYSAASAIWSSL